MSAKKSVVQEAVDLENAIAQDDASGETTREVLQELRLGEGAILTEAHIKGNERLLKAVQAVQKRVEDTNREQEEMFAALFGEEGGLFDIDDEE